MPICSVCGSEIVDTVVICPGCGSRINKAERELYRSRYNRWCAGVCAGIGEHASVSPTLVRIAMILFGLCLLGFLGFGYFLLYIAAYMLVAIMMREEPPTKPFCSMCGSEVVDTAEICPVCGYIIEQKLYRSCSDRWLAGVCGGIGKYTGIPPLLIRIAMILFGLCLFGFLWFGYFLLYIGMYILFAIMMKEEPQTNKVEGKFYRSSSNRRLAGVCGGISERTGISPTWIRIGMILLCFFLCGILGYLLLALRMPEEPQPNPSAEPEDTTN